MRALPLADGFAVYIDKPNGDVIGLYVSSKDSRHILNDLGPTFREVGETVWEYTETT